jgi:hypothetical protein
MGTSTSSTGPASGISMDPPWLDDINSDTSVPTDSDSSSEQENETPTEQPSTQAPLVVWSLPCHLMLFWWLFLKEKWRMGSQIPVRKFVILRWQGRTNDESFNLVVKIN